MCVSLAKPSIDPGYLPLSLFCSFLLLLKNGYAARRMAVLARDLVTRFDSGYRLLRRIIINIYNAGFDMLSGIVRNAGDFNEGSLRK